MERLRILGIGVLACLAALLVSCGGGGGGDSGASPGGGEVLLATLPVGFGTNCLTGCTSITSLQIALAWALGSTAGEVFPATPPLVAAQTGDFELRAGASPAVDQFFSMVTDGSDGQVGGGSILNPGDLWEMNIALESLSFQNVHPSLAGPDLDGATITRIVVSVTTVFIDNLNFTTTFAATVSFYGTL